MQSDGLCSQKSTEAAAQEPSPQPPGERSSPFLPRPGKDVNRKLTALNATTWALLAKNQPKPRTRNPAPSARQPAPAEEGVPLLPRPGKDVNRKLTALNATTWALLAKNQPKPRTRNPAPSARQPAPAEEGVPLLPRPGKDVNRKLTALNATTWALLAKNQPKPRTRNPAPSARQPAPAEEGVPLLPRPGKDVNRKLTALNATTWALLAKNQPKPRTRNPAPSARQPAPAEEGVPLLPRPGKDVNRKLTALNATTWALLAKNQPKPRTRNPAPSARQPAPAEEGVPLLPRPGKDVNRKLTALNATTWALLAKNQPKPRTRNPAPSPQHPAPANEVSSFLPRPAKDVNRKLTALNATTWALLAKNQPKPRTRNPAPSARQPAPAEEGVPLLPRPGKDVNRKLTALNATTWALLAKNQPKPRTRNPAPSARQPAPAEEGVPLLPRPGKDVNRKLTALNATTWALLAKNQPKPRTRNPAPSARQPAPAEEGVPLLPRPGKDVNRKLTALNATTWALLAKNQPKPRTRNPAPSARQPAPAEEGVPLLPRPGKDVNRKLTALNATTWALLAKNQPKPRTRNPAPSPQHPAPANEVSSFLPRPAKDVNRKLTALNATTWALLAKNQPKPRTRNPAPSARQPAPAEEGVPLLPRPGKDVNRKLTALNATTWALLAKNQPKPRTRNPAPSARQPAPAEEGVPLLPRPGKDVNRKLTALNATTWALLAKNQPKPRTRNPAPSARQPAPAEEGVPLLPRPGKDVNRKLTALNATTWALLAKNQPKPRTRNPAPSARQPAPAEEGVPLLPRPGKDVNRKLTALNATTWALLAKNQPKPRTRNPAPSPQHPAPANEVSSFLPRPAKDVNRKLTALNATTWALLAKNQPKPRTRNPAPSARQPAPAEEGVPLLPRPGKDVNRKLTALNATTWALLAKNQPKPRTRNPAPSARQPAPAEEGVPLLPRPGKDVNRKLTALNATTWALLAKNQPKPRTRNPAPSARQPAPAEEGVPLLPRPGKDVNRKLTALNATTWALLAKNQPKPRTRNPAPSARQPAPAEEGVPLLPRPGKDVNRKLTALNATTWALLAKNQPKPRTRNPAPSARQPAPAEEGVPLLPRPGKDVNRKLTALNATTWALLAKNQPKPRTRNPAPSPQHPAPANEVSSFLPRPAKDVNRKLTALNATTWALLAKNQPKPRTRNPAPSARQPAPAEEGVPLLPRPGKDVNRKLTALNATTWALLAKNQPKPRTRNPAPSARQPAPAEEGVPLLPRPGKDVNRKLTALNATTWALLAKNQPKPRTRNPAPSARQPAPAEEGVPLLPRPGKDVNRKLTALNATTWALLAKNQPKPRTRNPAPSPQHPAPANEVSSFLPRPAKDVNRKLTALNATTWALLAKNQPKPRTRNPAPSARQPAPAEEGVPLLPRPGKDVNRKLTALNATTWALLAKNQPKPRTRNPAPSARQPAPAEEGVPLLPRPGKDVNRKLTALNATTWALLAKNQPKPRTRNPAPSARQPAPAEEGVPLLPRPGKDVNRKLTALNATTWALLAKNQPKPRTRNPAPSARQPAPAEEGVPLLPRPGKDVNRKLTALNATTWALLAKNQPKPRTRNPAPSPQHPAPANEVSSFLPRPAKDVNRKLTALNATTWALLAKNQPKPRTRNPAPSARQPAPAEEGVPLLPRPGKDVNRKLTALNATTWALLAKNQPKPRTRNPAPSARQPAPAEEGVPLLPRPGKDVNRKLTALNATTWALLAKNQPKPRTRNPAPSARQPAPAEEGVPLLPRPGKDVNRKLTALNATTWALLAKNQPKPRTRNPAPSPQHPAPANEVSSFLPRPAKDVNRKLTALNATTWALLAKNQPKPRTRNPAPSARQPAPAEEGVPLLPRPGKDVNRKLTALNATTWALLAKNQPKPRTRNPAPSPQHPAPANEVSSFLPRPAKDVNRKLTALNATTWALLAKNQPKPRTRNPAPSARQPAPAEEGVPLLPRPGKDVNRKLTALNATTWALLAKNQPKPRTRNPAPSPQHPAPANEVSSFLPRPAKDVNRKLTALNATTWALLAKNQPKPRTRNPAPSARQPAPAEEGVPLLPRPGKDVNRKLTALNATTWALLAKNQPKPRTRNPAPSPQHPAPANEVSPFLPRPGKDVNRKLTALNATTWALLAKNQPKPRTRNPAPSPQHPAPANEVRHFCYYSLLPQHAHLPSDCAGNRARPDRVPAHQQYRASLPHLLAVRLANRKPHVRHRPPHRNAPRRADLLRARLGADHRPRLRCPLGPRRRTGT